MKGYKNKNTNDLIPELIKKINKYSSKLKERVKIDSIFREFDSYAHSNFQNFIKMSEQRYKSVKSGNCLDNVLSKQSQQNKDLSNKILSNHLYIDDDIEKESKKLFKKINTKENKELYDIRHNILVKTKNYKTKEIKRKEKYSNSISKQIGTEKKLEEQNRKGILKNKLDLTHKQKYNNKSVVYPDKYNKRKDSNDIKDKEEIIAKKLFFDNLVLKDNQNLNNNISDYKEYLKDIENNKDNINISNISRIINNGNNFGHQYSFKIKDIKLLSYKEEKKEDIKINKKENPEIDLVKLIRYTKRGNKKWFQDSIKQRSKNRLNSFKNKFKRKKQLFSSSSAINIGRKKLLNKINEDNNKQNEENSYNDINLMGATSSTAFSNFKNTLKTVKNEAEMVKNINQNFDKKRNTMEGFFKRSTLPKLEEYETMFKTRNNFLKNNNYVKDNNSINIIKNNINLKNSLNGNIKHNLKDELINMDIFLDFQKTYHDKKIKWAEEDIQKEKIKQKEKEIIEETKKYLKEIKQVKRKAHLYIDPYSKRDELINNRIQLFTRSLSSPFYSQKKLQSKINDFNNYIELKEIEKRKNDENLAKTMKEEEKKRREQAEEYKLLEKIKKNLENDDNNNVGDIKLNYKFISTLKMCKNEDKDQPYKDYKEIYEIIKDKKRNGEYNLNCIKEVKN